MAELIPLEYRIRVARAQLMSRWTTALIVTVAVMAAALLQTYMWKRRQTADYARLEQQYRESSVFIKQYNELHAQREDLARRMKKMEDLRTDKVLVSLLNSVSTCFSEYDCLEYVCIEAHPADRKPAESQYSVRVRGITANDTTHSRFLERLTDIGKKSQPPIKVPLGEKHLLIMLDGEVTSFDITCEQPLAKGG
jgi:Tfp pilus assembly protein PilO